jgi:hypothetical protein
MSSMSQNAAQTAPASIAKPKNKLFGLSREELKIVTGGSGVIVMDPNLPIDGDTLNSSTGQPVTVTPPIVVAPETILAP